MFQAENTEVLGISANQSFSQRLSPIFGKSAMRGVYDEPRRLAKLVCHNDKEGVIHPLSEHSTE